MRQVVAGRKPGLSTSWAVWLVVAVCLAGAAVAAPSVEQQLQETWRRCEQTPEYRVGGAAQGDCLLVAAEATDGAIRQRLHRFKMNECPALAEAFDTAQRLWEEYRQAHCGLHEKAFDNTPSFVGAAECHLRLTLTRERELQILAQTLPTARDPCEP